MVRATCYLKLISLSKEEASLVAPGKCNCVQAANASVLVLY